jgi:hypothetical protein
VNNKRGSGQLAQTERADDVGGGILTRRGLLGGLAALPVIYSVGSVTPAMAPNRPSAAPVTDDTADTDDLVRGVERRYNVPLLTPGTRSEPMRRHDRTS